MCQVEKHSSVVVDPICGPLDINFSRSATSIILMTQMFIALIAFFTVQFSTWCLQSVGSIRTFTTMALIVFWINMIFLVVFVCNLPYKMQTINWLLLSFLQQFFCALFILIAIIVLAINPCTIGQMIGVIVGVVLLLLYLLGALLVYRNYNKPDRSTEPMDPVNADIPQVAHATRVVRERLDDFSTSTGISKSPSPRTDTTFRPPYPAQPPTVTTNSNFSNANFNSNNSNNLVDPPNYKSYGGSYNNKNNNNGNRIVAFKKIGDRHHNTDDSGSNPPSSTYLPRDNNTIAAGPIYSGPSTSARSQTPPTPASGDENYSSSIRPDPFVRAVVKTDTEYRS